LELTFANVPKVKEMVYNWFSKCTASSWQFFPHPFGNGSMSVRYKGSNNDASGQEKFKRPLVASKFHGRTASNLICLINDF